MGQNFDMDLQSERNDSKDFGSKMHLGIHNICFIYSFIHLYAFMYILSSIYPAYVLVFYHNSNQYHKFSILI